MLCKGDLMKKIIGGKCGCLFCLGKTIPKDRSGWKSLRNKEGRIYGVRPKGSKKPKTSGI